MWKIVYNYNLNTSRTSLSTSNLSIAAHSNLPDLPLNSNLAVGTGGERTEREEIEEEVEEERGGWGREEEEEWGGGKKWEEEEEREGEEGEGKMRERARRSCWWTPLWAILFKEDLSMASDSVWLSIWLNVSIIFCGDTILCFLFSSIFMIQTGINNNIT